jgi:hypothetical protein
MPAIRTSRGAVRRLLQVELRKTVDTRSGRWLLTAIGLITVAVIAPTCSPPTPTR